MPTRSNRNAGVDLFRLLAALTVVVNHSRFTVGTPSLALWGRWTVPFFFMVSGYYFQQAFGQQSMKAFAKILKALLTLMLVANSVYGLFVGLTDGSLDSLNTHFTLFVGTYFHLWFLTSLILGYGILWLFLAYDYEKFLPLLAVLVLMLTLVLNPYSYLIGLSPHPIYARSLLSIPFLCIGFLIAKFGLQTLVSRPTAYLMAALGACIQVGEVWFLSRNEPQSLPYNFVGGTLLFSVGLFLVALQLPLASNSLVSYYGRRYSLAFYLYHPAVNYLVCQTGTKADTTFYGLGPFLSVLLLFLMLLVLDRLSPRSLQALTGNFQGYTLMRKYTGRG